MIEQASLVIGEGNWAVKSDSLLGYKINGGKYYPREMSVVRATTGTRINEDGLVELVPYNLLSYSEQFNNVAWTQSSVTITSNSTTAPNGTTTADTIAFSSGSFVSQSYTHSGVHTFSIYAKYIGTQWLCVENYNNADLAAWFDIQNGVIGTIASGATANIENVGNGWYRCSVTMTANSAYTSTYATFNTTTNGGFTRTGSSYFWGAQVVEGSTALDYLPTTDRLDVARIDYSSGSGALLVEPQRTNLCLYSNNLSVSPWINQTTNTTLTRIQSGGPDGNSFDRLVIGGSVGSYQGRYVQAASNVGANAVYSVYLKGSGQVSIQLYNGVSSPQIFVTLTNEWTRYNTVSTSGSGGYIDWNLFVFGGTTCDVAFHQLEFATYQTSYIPTQSAAVTRNADVISKTGIADLIGQTEGTLFAEIDWVNNGNDVVFSTLSDGTTSNRIHFGYAASGNNWYLYVESGGASQVNITLAAPTNGKYRIAVAYELNDYVFYVNGVLIGSDTSATVPSTSQLNVGGFITTGLEYSNRATALYKTRLTNAQLATLTTI